MFAQNSKITLAGLRGLMAETLHALLAQYGCPSVRIVDDTDSTAILDACDIILTTSDFMVANLDIFLSRRSKTAVLLSGTVLQQSSAGITTILPSDSADTMVGKLEALLPVSESGRELQSELTPREKAVLAEIASGKTNKEISETLYISINTVLTHRKNLTRKLGIRSASGLTLYAIMNGLVNPTD